MIENLWGMIDHGCVLYKYIYISSKTIGDDDDVDHSLSIRLVRFFHCVKRGLKVRRT